MWKSPSQQDNALHTAVTNSFNHLGFLARKAKDDEAEQILVRASECNEVGLGFSIKRRGRKIGIATAKRVIALFKDIPQVRENGFTHFEEIQLFVEKLSKDRISDITCNFLMSFLVDFTIEQCEKNEIPTKELRISNVYDYRKNEFDESENLRLPYSPGANTPIVFVPKRWLRTVPWIGYEDYVQNYYLKEIASDANPKDRVSVLNYNRRNYDMVQLYVREKERKQSDCKTSSSL